MQMESLGRIVAALMVPVYTSTTDASVFHGLMCVLFDVSAYN